MKPDKKRPLFPIGILLLLICLIPVAAAAVGISPELRAALSLTAPGEPIAVIITFVAPEPSAVLARRFGRTRRGALIQDLKARNETALVPVRQLLQHHQINEIRPLWLADGVAVSAPAGVIAALAALPGVESLSIDETLHAPQVQAAEAAEPAWNIHRAGAPLLWSLGYRGEGVTVAILDSGLNRDHPDLVERWRGLPGDWFDPYGECLSPCDSSSYHGTGVAGVVAGGSTGGSAIGMAPAASLIAAKIFRADGTANTSYIVQALQWVLEPGGNPANAPAIVNNSWGFDAVDECSRPLALSNAIKALKAAGIAVIASAGNSGGAAGEYFTSISPANYPEILAVGATDDLDQVPYFSSRGPSACPGDDSFPDLVAPGVSIRVAAATEGSHRYLIRSGTSFAAPHLAGAMALLIQAEPDISLEILEEVLKYSAIDLGVAGVDDDSGYGLLDVKAAFDLLGAAEPAITQLTVDPEQLNFGQVPPGNTHTRHLDLISSGTETLTLGVDLRGLPAPFALADTSCATSLAPGEVCTLTFNFTPQQTGTFAAEVVIESSDPVNPAVAIPLFGTSNTAPSQPQLISPADNERVPFGEHLILSWIAATDADGDVVEHSLLLADNSFFFEAQIFQAFTNLAIPLLLGSLFVSTVSGRHKKVALLPLVLVVFWLGSCGGGGSGDGGRTTQGVADDSTVMSRTLGELPPGTYYWKVLAEDGRGGGSESLVRSFTVE